MPNGYGVLLQKIRLSPDGGAFDSTIALELFDAQGKPMAGGGKATARGRRIWF